MPLGRRFTRSFQFWCWLCYFGLFEGLRGASPGKALCRLRVVGLDGKTPGARKGLVRALIFCGPVTLPTMALMFLFPDWTTPRAGDPAHALFAMIPWGVQLVAFILLFSTCRRRNGFAGLHDLWSGTRVVSRSVLPVRPIQPLALEAAPATAEMPQIGPYHILGELGRSGDAEMLLGYDARLLRKVWLRTVAPRHAAAGPCFVSLGPSGTPPLVEWQTVGRRMLGRL